jgi:hypothetical protein
MSKRPLLAASPDRAPPRPSALSERPRALHSALRRAPIPPQFSRGRLHWSGWADPRSAHPRARAPLARAARGVRGPASARALSPKGRRGRARNGRRAERGRRGRGRRAAGKARRAAGARALSGWNRPGSAAPALLQFAGWDGQSAGRRIPCTVRRRNGL